MALSDSVSQWLHDLRDETEHECMCILQGKSLTKESADLVFVVSKSAKDNVLTVHQTMVLIKSEVKKLLRYVEYDKWESVKNTSQKLVNQIHSQIRNCQSDLRDIPSYLVKLIQNLTQDCLQLTQHVECTTSRKTHQRRSRPKPATELVNRQISDACETVEFQGRGHEGEDCDTKRQKDLLCRLVASIEQSLQMLVDYTLAVLIQNITDKCARLCRCHGDTDAVVPVAKSRSNGNAVTNGYSEIKFSDSKRNDSSFLSDALMDIITIGLQSNHMCSLLAKVGCVSLLLKICRTSELRFVHGEALRALATVCCVGESIEQLDIDGGIGCLTDILTNSEIPEKIRSEAAGVIAQVTSPSLATCQLQMGFIENVPDLVRSLTGLCRDASDHNIFLMSCAALANMTSIDNMTCDYLAQCGTSTVLVESCLKNKALSVFAKEQVATVIGNMASVDSCNKDLIADQRVLEQLVYFLDEHARSGATAMELASCERVLLTVSMAIGQLSQQKPVAVAFVKLQCVRRLVQLCNDPILRNHSDAVLMACLTALRKIFSVCGPNHEVLAGEVEASRLVTSKIIDSFVLGTSADESFI